MSAKIKHDLFASVVCSCLREARHVTPTASMMEDDAALFDLLLQGMSEPEAGAKRRMQQSPEAADMKRARMNEKEENVDDVNSTTWNARLERAFAETRLARGKQKRTLEVHSVCTGMATHHYALQARSSGNLKRVRSHYEFSLLSQAFGVGLLCLLERVLLCDAKGLPSFPEKLATV